MGDALRDSLTHELHCQFYDYWRAVAPAGGLLPGRQHIYPEDIPRLLPCLYMRDVVRGPDGIRFRTRLMGTKLVQVMGRDTTGQFMEEAFDPDYVARQREVYLRVIESRSPDLIEMQAPIHDKEHIRYARLLLPLAADGRTVDILLGMIVFIR